MEFPGPSVHPGASGRASAACGGQGAIFAGFRRRMMKYLTLPSICSGMALASALACAGCRLAGRADASAQGPEVSAAAPLIANAVAPGPIRNARVFSLAARPADTTVLTVSRPWQ